MNKWKYDARWCFTSNCKIPDWLASKEIKRVNQNDLSEHPGIRSVFDEIQFTPQRDAKYKLVSHSKLFKYIPLCMLKDIRTNTWCVAVRIVLVRNQYPDGSEHWDDYCKTILKSLESDRKRVLSKPLRAKPYQGNNFHLCWHMDNAKYVYPDYERVDRNDIFIYKKERDKYHFVDIPLTHFPSAENYIIVSEHKRQKDAKEALNKLVLKYAQPLKDEDDENKRKTINDAFGTPLKGTIGELGCRQQENQKSLPANIGDLVSYSRGERGWVWQIVQEDTKRANPVKIKPVFTGFDNKKASKLCAKYFELGHIDLITISQAHKKLTDIIHQLVKQHSG